MKAKLTPDEQRHFIAELMIRREWNPGVTHKALAEEWGIGVRQVSERALQASRAIQIAGNVKDFVSEALTELDSLAQEARALGKPRDAAYCIELKAKILGALAPTKTQAVEPDAVANMTPAEKLEAHEKAAEELRAELAKGQQNGVH